MSRSTFSQWVTSYVIRRREKPRTRKLTRVSTFEQLGARITPTVNAFFTGGHLTILGDAADNTIVVSRDAAGTLQVNGGAIPIRGGTPTIANITRLQIFGLSGNDTLTLDETNGALPAANLFGGAGNDTLTGGSRDDLLFGQAGNDTSSAAAESIASSVAPIATRSSAARRTTSPSERAATTPSAGTSVMAATWSKVRPGSIPWFSTAP